MLSLYVQHRIYMGRRQSNTPLTILYLRANGAVRHLAVTSPSRAVRTALRMDGGQEELR